MPPLKPHAKQEAMSIRSFKVHLTPAQAIPDLKVGMSVLFKVKESK